MINIYTIDIHYSWLFPFSFSHSVSFRSNGLNSDIVEKCFSKLLSCLSDGISKEHNKTICREIQGSFSNDQYFINYKTSHYYQNRKVKGITKCV